MKPFEYDKNTLFDIMNYNLSILINKNDFDLIKVWDNQYEFFINDLIDQEKFEFCDLLEKNKSELVIKGIFTSIITPE